MKRGSPAAWGACAAVLVAGRAQAAEHLMRINEILRSYNATTTIQFVELVDLNSLGETFPSGPYKLELFDVNAASLGSTGLTLTPTPVHGHYIATAAADAQFGTTRQDTLNTVLPENGQLCFEDGLGTKIDCVAWGCITTFVKSPPNRAPSPPDGMSVQRISEGMYVLAAPTPNATNVTTGTMIPACPTDPLDGPPAFEVVPDDGGLHDAPVGGNDHPAGGGGCCEVDGTSGATGAGLLVATVLVALRRRRQN